MRKIDQVVEELVGSGLSEQDIATEVGSSQPTVNRIRNGKQEPLDGLGQALRQLHRERCPDRTAA